MVAKGGLPFFGQQVVARQQRELVVDPAGIAARDDAIDTANRFKWGIVGGIVGFAVLIVGSIVLATRGRGEPRA